MNQIVALRDLGFGLAEIGEMTGDRLAPTEMRDMLAQRQEQLAAELEAAERRLRGIDSRISQLEEHTRSIDIVVRAIPEQSVWTMDYQTANIEEAFDALSCMARHCAVGKALGFDLPGSPKRWRIEDGQLYVNKNAFAATQFRPLARRIRRLAEGASQ